MEKLNIAKLLKDCPKGMELYSTIYGTVYFDGVRDTGYAVLIDIKTSCNTEVQFYPDGKFNTYYSDSEMTLFPSKDVRTWEGFQRPFKDGDIVATENGIFIGIVKVKNNMQVGAYCSINEIGTLSINASYVFERLATEEERQKLFKAIKDNGYKWNEETKTLEKLDEPKFKVGDKVLWNYDTEIQRVISKVELTSTRGYVYWIDCDGCSSGWWSEDELTPIPDKFDITTLKPFDKVLVRDNVEQKWIIDFFGFMNNDKGFPFVCVGHYVTQCIPYEKNEHLLGSNNDCDDFYKTWE